MAWMDGGSGLSSTPLRPRARRAMRETVDIKLVVFDLAGTLIDHGSLAPVEAFVQAFRSGGIDLAAEEARAPMGLDKMAHIHALLATPAVVGRFRARHGRAPNDDDAHHLYECFVPHQLAAIERRASLVPGALAVLHELRERGIHIAVTTGYFREAAESVLASMRRQGFEPDAWASADDVAHARPAPWMLTLTMQRLNVFPPSAVVKVGDTPYDIEEGLNAGAWAIGVARTGSLIGLSEEAWMALPDDAQRAHLADARERLLRAGAHRVMDSVADLPTVLDLL
jgi:phosphonoacetaldehyde hydrolase